MSACLLSAAKTNLPVAGYPASPQAADGRFRNPAPKPADGAAKTLGIVWNVLQQARHDSAEGTVAGRFADPRRTGRSAGPEPVPARALDDADQAALGARINFESHMVRVAGRMTVGDASAAIEPSKYKEI